MEDQISIKEDIEHASFCLREANKVLQKIYTAINKSEQEEIKDEKE